MDPRGGCGGGGWMKKKKLYQIIVILLYYMLEKDCNITIVIDIKRLYGNYSL